MLTAKFSRGGATLEAPVSRGGVMRREEGLGPIGYFVARFIAAPMIGVIWLSCTIDGAYHRHWAPPYFWYGPGNHVWLNLWWLVQDVGTAGVLGGFGLIALWIFRVVWRGQNSK